MACLCLPKHHDWHRQQEMDLWWQFTHIGFRSLPIGRSWTEITKIHFGQRLETANISWRRKCEGSSLKLAPNAWTLVLSDVPHQGQPNFRESSRSGGNWPQSTRADRLAWRLSCQEIGHQVSRKTLPRSTYRVRAAWLLLGLRGTCSVFRHGLQRGQGMLRHLLCEIIDHQFSRRIE